MKNLLIAITLMLGLGLVSCKKEKSYTCKIYYTYLPFNSQVTKKEYGVGTKKDMKDHQKAIEQEYANNELSELKSVDCQRN